ncbi:MAG: YybS family protein [Gemmatimonadota bacterium]|nr:YybS family protein [Gemmatimonadota bacterium]
MNPSDGPAVPPREQRWGGILLALAAYLLLSQLFFAFLPIAETIVLLIPSLAACFLAGWWGGGRFILAALWIGLATWGLTRPPAAHAASAYNDVTRSWALLTAGTFGLVSLVAPAQRFFGRALAAGSLALLLGFIMLLVTRGTPEQVQRVFVNEYARKTNLYAMAADAQVSLSAAREGAEKTATVRKALEGLVVQAHQWSKSAAPLYPALLILESLAAYGLAWGLYHRLSRTRIGPALSPLREFRFNDQMVWGFVAGTFIVLLPQLSLLGAVGWNLLVLFGAVYALRGFGIISWLINRVWMGGRVANILAIIGLVLLAPVVAPAALLSALGLGVMDTWIDWRARARPIS